MLTNAVLAGTSEPPEVALGELIRSFEPVLRCDELHQDPTSQALSRSWSLFVIGSTASGTRGGFDNITDPHWLDREGGSLICTLRKACAETAPRDLARLFATLSIRVKASSVDGRPITNAESAAAHCTCALEIAHLLPSIIRRA